MQMSPQFFFFFKIPIASPPRNTKIFVSFLKEKSYYPGTTNLDSILKSRDITLPTKVRLIKAMVFPVVMYRCESWTVNKAEHRRIDAFWTEVLEKTLESPLDCKEIKPVNPKAKSTLTDAEAPILWPPDSKNWLIGKDPDAGKDWGQEEKGTAEDETDTTADSMDMSLSKLQDTV